MTSLNADLLICTKQAISEIDMRAIGNHIAVYGADVCELSTKERAVLIMLCKGFRNHEIAQQLRISTRTVKWYVSRLLSKFKVTNRTELVGAITGAQCALTGGRS